MDLKNFRLNLWYIGVTYRTQTDLWYIELDWKSTQTTLIDLKGFSGILDLDLKNTWTNLLDSDLFYYNQAGMLLEKNESTWIIW